MNPWFAALVAYLVGSIPFAALAARAKGIDLRAHGSGNLGATNAIRVLGPGLGIPVLLGDVAKGWFAAAIVPRLAADGSLTTQLLCAGAGVLGHIFPVFLRLRGGKGVATAAGAFLALAPGPIAVAALAFVLVLAASRFVSLASIAASITLVVGLWVAPCPLALRVLGTAIAALVLVRHRTNVGRLLAGTESRVTGPRAGRKS